MLNEEKRALLAMTGWLQRLLCHGDGLCTGLPDRLRSLCRLLFLRHPEPRRGYTTLVNLLT